MLIPANYACFMGQKRSILQRKNVCPTVRLLWLSPSQTTLSSSPAPLRCQPSLATGHASRHLHDATPPHPPPRHLRCSQSSRRSSHGVIPLQTEHEPFLSIEKQNPCPGHARVSTQLKPNLNSHLSLDRPRHPSSPTLLLSNTHYTLNPLFL